MHSELERRLAQQKTSLGEPVGVVALEQSEGATARDPEWTRAAREEAIKEYFFGDTRRTLSPFTHSVNFDDLTIFKVPDGGFLDLRNTIPYCC